MSATCPAELKVYTAINFEICPV